MRFLLFFRFVVFPITVWLTAVQTSGASFESSGGKDVILSHTPAYSFMWWAHGWRGRSEAGEKILNLQASSYGLSIDVEKADLLHLGPIQNPADYLAAAAEGNERVFGLPKPEFQLTVLVGEAKYACARVNPRAASSLLTVASGASLPDRLSEMDGFPCRLICSGRFVQRADLMYLEFEDETGAQLPALGRLEIIAWPDRLTFWVEAVFKTNLENVRLALQLVEGGKNHLSQTLPRSVKTGERIEAILEWRPGDSPEESPSSLIMNIEDSAEVSLPVVYEATGNWNCVKMRSQGRDMAADPNHQDRFHLRIENPTDSAQPVRLFFEFDGDAIPPITGFSPMLLDTSGQPTGIPVQISKNWHRREGAEYLYQGPWFHGYTLFHLGPKKTWEGQFCVAAAHWGGVPAVSHSQLCLVGWGTNQLWDQAAIGSWGESICYDPDVNLNRSMIDDVRPLMVWGMNDRKGGKWTWTNNVGGGDFLVYFDNQGKKRYLTRMKTAYRRYCPNLTEVTYAGVTADNRIAAKITVSSPRSDDLNRAYHHIRYDVLEPTPFSRLAFYQLGADHYNDHEFDRLAMGNAEGLVEEWSVEKGGLRYWKSGLPCSGPASWWFSLHEARPFREAKGAWANRGLVVRSWKAQLGGKEAPYPFAAFYGTENGVPSANVEIIPPPGLTQLDPGDFLEADLELLVLPMSASDYYGPNEDFRKALARDANTWRMVYREAVGNNLEVAPFQGALLRSQPIAIEVGEDESAEFSVSGGTGGFVPITFTGLRSPYNFSLFRMAGGTFERVDQSQKGNDFWQTDYDPSMERWERTYNLRLEEGTHHFRFQPD